jgi:hypothetical protein
MIAFYSEKSKYIRKKGKVAEGLNEQSNGFYSGKILFDDGTDAYFYKVKVTCVGLIIQFFYNQLQKLLNGQVVLLVRFIYIRSCKRVKSILE